MSSSATTPNAYASTEDFEFAALREANNYRARLVERFRPLLKGNVLEVGAGIGQISQAIIGLPDVTDFCAVEPDARFLPALRKVVPAPQIVVGTAHNVDSRKQWDAIVSINVLEHIERDEEELTLYRKLLAPYNGHLCMLVPACAEIYAPLDREFGHFRRYSKSELRSKIERTGFEVMDIRYFNFFGYFAWWATFCLLRRRSFNPNAVRFYDRMLFPITHWLETHLCPAPLGQSLIVIAKAKSMR